MRYLLLTGLLLVCQMALAQPDPFPKVASSYLIQVNGDLVWERQADRRLSPASLTKLMAASAYVRRPFRVGYDRIYFRTPGTWWTPAKVPQKLLELAEAGGTRMIA
jgi:hypothetical protein